MKKKLIKSLLVLAAPVTGIAQNQSEIPKGACASSPFGMINHYFATYFGWPLLILSVTTIISWIIMVPIRAYHRQLARVLNVALIVVVFAIWYFYPCLNFKGTYSKTVYWSNGKQIQSVSIGEKYTDGVSVYEYHLKPIRRMLWIDIQEEQSLLPWPYYPVKLGWNKIYVWDFKSGNWDKLKKEKEPVSRRKVPIL